MASKIETTMRATLAALDAGDPDKAARLLRAAIGAIMPAQRKPLTDEEFLAPARAFHVARNAAIAAARAACPNYRPEYTRGIGGDYIIVRARTRAEWHNAIDYRGQRHKGRAVDWYAVPEAKYWPGGVYPAGLEVHPVKSEAETVAWLRDELARCEAEAAKTYSEGVAPPVAQAVWRRRVASLRAEMSALQGVWRVTGGHLYAIKD